MNEIGPAGRGDFHPGGMAAIGRWLREQGERYHRSLHPGLFRPRQGAQQSAGDFPGVERVLLRPGWGSRSISLGRLWTGKWRAESFCAGNISVPNLSVFLNSHLPEEALRVCPGTDAVPAASAIDDISASRRVIPGAGCGTPWFLSLLCVSPCRSFLCFC